MIRGIVTSLLLVAAAVSASPAGAGAQQRIVVLTEPGTPVVATDILLAAGPIDEGPARAGVAHLAGRAILARLRPALDSLGVRAAVLAEKDALSFSIIAAPDAWEEAMRLTMQAIFGEAPPASFVDAERRAVVNELASRLANPADAATREQDAAFFGTLHPWGRSTVGTPESVGRLTPAQVAAFMRETFVPDRAFIAVAGPLDEATVAASLQPLFTDARPAAVEAVPPDSEVLPVRRDYDSITSWVSASYAFPATADEEAIRFVVFLTADALSYSPAQRSVYNIWSEVSPRVGGGEARIQVVVPPEEVDDWAERLRRYVADLRTATMIDDVFEANLRRFRGERTMSLISPEARAHAAARQLLVRGHPTGLMPGVEEMTLDRMRAAAEALGRPTLVILGPSLTQN